jgi:error-prone DNA polymerase
MRYAELQIATNFSFLRGASHAEEICAAAKVLDLTAIGIADRNTVAGVVRAHEAAQKTGVRLLVGSRLTFRDGTPDLLCYPTDRVAWGRLTRLLSDGKQGTTPKGECFLDYDLLSKYAGGQVLIVIPPPPAGCRILQETAALVRRFPTPALSRDYSPSSRR